MRDADDQDEKRLIADGEESMAARRSSEKSGRLRRVEGTEREIARGTRAEEKAAGGRMSTMRAAWSLSQGSRSSGATTRKGVRSPWGAGAGIRKRWRERTRWHWDYIYYTVTSWLSRPLYSSPNMDPPSPSDEEPISTYFFAGPRAPVLRPATGFAIIP